MGPLKNVVLQENCPIWLQRTVAITAIMAVVGAILGAILLIHLQVGGASHGLTSGGAAAILGCSGGLLGILGILALLRAYALNHRKAQTSASPPTDGPAQVVDASQPALGATEEPIPATQEGPAAPQAVATNTSEGPAQMASGATEKPMPATPSPAEPSPAVAAAPSTDKLVLMVYTGNVCRIKTVSSSMTYEEFKKHCDGFTPLEEFDLSFHFQQKDPTELKKTFPPPHAGSAKRTLAAMIEDYQPKEGNWELEKLTYEKKATAPPAAVPAVAAGAAPARAKPSSRPVAAAPKQPTLRIRPTLVLSQRKPLLAFNTLEQEFSLPWTKETTIIDLTKVYLDLKYGQFKKQQKSPETYVAFIFHFADGTTDGPSEDGTAKIQDILQKKPGCALNYIECIDLFQVPVVGEQESKKIFMRVDHTYEQLKALFLPAVPPEQFELHFCFQRLDGNKERRIVSPSQSPADATLADMMIAWGMNKPEWQLVQVQYEKVVTERNFVVVEGGKYTSLTLSSKTTYGALKEQYSPGKASDFELEFVFERVSASGVRNTQDVVRYCPTDPQESLADIFKKHEKYQNGDFVDTLELKEVCYKPKQAAALPASPPPAPSPLPPFPAVTSPSVDLIVNCSTKQIHNKDESWSVSIEGVTVGALKEHFAKELSVEPHEVCVSIGDGVDFASEKLVSDLPIEYLLGKGDLVVSLQRSLEFAIMTKPAIQGTLHYTSRSTIGEVKALCRAQAPPSDKTMHLILIFEGKTVVKPKNDDQTMGELLKEHAGKSLEKALFSFA